MVICAVLLLISHKLTVDMSSELSRSATSVQRRSNYSPESCFLVTFTMLIIIQTHREGPEPLHLFQLATGILGFYSIVRRCAKTNAFYDFRLKYLHCLVYLTGAWFFAVLHVIRILDKLDRPIIAPLRVSFLGYFLLVLASIVLRPKSKLKSLDLKNYGYYES